MCIRDRLGAEGTPGWRWPDLLGARGEVTDVRRFLPQVDGLTVVSMGRPVPVSYTHLDVYKRQAL